MLLKNKKHKYNLSIIIFVALFFVLFSVNIKHSYATTCEEKGGVCFYPPYPPKDIKQWTNVSNLLCMKQGTNGYQLGNCYFPKPACNTSAGCVLRSLCPSQAEGYCPSQDFLQSDMVCCAKEPISIEDLSAEDVLGDLLTPVPVTPEMQRSADLMFKPEIGFPGFDGEHKVDGSLLGNFISSMLIYIVYLSGVVAVIILVIAGFQWVLAGGNPSIISQAKEKIKNAIIGLILCSCSYLILYIINPELLNIREIGIDYIESEPIISIENPDFISGALAGDSYEATPSSADLNFNNPSDPKGSTDDGKGVLELKDYFCLGTETEMQCPFFGYSLSNANCSISWIEKAMFEKHTKVTGPCHCACFVTSSLARAGCGNCVAIAVQTQVDTKLGNLKWHSTTNRNRIPRLGDVITMNGHTVFSLGTYLYNKGKKNEYCVSWILHSTPINTDYSWMPKVSGKANWRGCGQYDDKCSYSWDSLNGGYKEWFVEGKCTSNQAVLITRNNFTLYTDYRLWIHPENYKKYGDDDLLLDMTNKGSTSCISAESEEKFRTQYGDPNAYARSNADFVRFLK